MKLFRKISKTEVIESESGCYEVWAEKVFCNNRYMFFARQISVKVNGQNYYIDKPTFKYFAQDWYFAPTVQFEVSLKRLQYNYQGKITRFKKELERFKYEVRRMATNNIKIA